MPRLLTALMTVALCALVIAPAALAKENVTAKLDAPVPRDAPAGSTITVSWTLTDRNGRPFGASGVFIRLLSASGARSTRATAESGSGRFVVRVKVPEGGLKAVKIGLDGIRKYPDGRTEPAPIYFPIAGDADPVQGTAVTDDDDGWPAWLIAGSLIAALTPLLILLRRRRARPA